MVVLRQISINVILIASFAAVSFIIFTPLIAEIQSDSAETLITRYLWKNAQEKLEVAMRFDPCDSRYPARLGEFLFTQSTYKDNPLPLLKKAQGYYERAARLNPNYAEYFTMLGQIKLAVFLEDPSGKKLIEDSFSYFKKAIGDDPNGFNTAYAVGYPGLSVWKYLNANERAVVIDRLKFSLKQKPWYSGYIYPQVLRETGNPKLLKRIMPEIEAKQWVNPDKVKELKSNISQTKITGTISRSGWRGTSSDGGGVYEDGNMYWSGTIYGVMLFPTGDALIKLEARGSPCDGVYPYMLVSLDGNKIGSAYVDNVEFKKYSFAAKTDGGIKVLSVTFTNDGGNKKEDRNLYVGNAQVEQR